MITKLLLHLTCVSLIIVIQSEAKNLSDLSPPQIEPQQDHAVINSGDTWEVNCTGEAPLEWEYSNSTREHVTVTEIGQNPFVSNLKLEKAQFWETGEYTCKYKDLEVEEEETDPNIGSQSQVYLFVYDENHLIDFEVQPETTALQNVHENYESIIPCRPTHPNVTITIFRYGRDITNNLDKYHYQFDPKRGIIIENGNKVHHRDGSKIECRANYGNVEQKYNFNIQFHEDTKVSPPHIKHPKSSDPLKYEYPVVNQTYLLVCEKKFYGGQHMPRGFELEWIIPSNSRYQIMEQNVSAIAKKPIGLHSSSPRRHDFIFTKNLTIYPILKEDENVTFKCVLTKKNPNATKESSPVSKTIGYIRGLENEPFFGEVKFHGSPELNLPGSVYIGKDINWSLTAFATPDPDYRWFNPKGYLIDFDLPQTSMKYDLDVDDSTHRITLTIKHLLLSDMGHYILEILVNEGSSQGFSADKNMKKKTIDMYLNVKRDPEVKVKLPEKNIYPFVMANEETTLTCEVEGFPIDQNNLEWSFRACQGYDDCVDPEEQTKMSQDFYTNLVPSDGNTNGSQHYQFQSNLRTRIEKSGEYICKVCSLSNQEKCGLNSIQVFANEFSPMGFEIIRPTGYNLQKLVQGDDIAMSCIASKYKYHKVTWYKRNSRTNETSVFERSDAVEYRKTEFSHVGVITFESVDIQDSGEYECHASKIILDEHEAEASVSDILKEKLVVLKAMPPFQNDSFNMKIGTKLNPSQGQEEKVTLDCSMKSGRPTPVISWYKDDKNFTQKQNTSYRLISFSPDNSKITFEYITVDDSGSYRCVANNRVGKVVGEIKLDVQEPINFPPFVIGLIVAGCAIVLILSVVLAWRVKVYNAKYKQLSERELKMFNDGDPTSINSELGVDDQADLLPYNKSFEFERDKLKLGKQLGSGAFGRVVKAQAMGINSWERSTTVAVKMVKANADIMYIKALMSELKIMIHLGRHLNIVNLLGACTHGLAKRELFIIVEYCRFGNLQKYLLQHRNHYISQIDPMTGALNFTIGQDVIDGFGENEFARIREEAEFSAVYLVPNPPNNTEESTDNQVTIQNEPPQRQPSIRYVVNPADKRHRKRTISSDFSMAGQIVNTDMTTLAEEDESVEEVDPSRPMVGRSVSLLSRGSQGPGWRANMRGDYDPTNIKPIATKDLISWAYQVTRGMEYLATKKVMHGDLACRNILLAADNVVKICDFGLAKDIYKNNTYQKKSDGPLPVKWMAIESIRDRVFSTESDVWAFGIVLWEMFSLGKTPYPGVEACDLYHMLLREHRMEKPEVCPQALYDMMLRTWDNNPTQRPNFLELMDELGDLLEEGTLDEYINLEKNFDATTIGNPDNHVENMDYLGQMAPQDFTSQMSVTPAHVSPEDGYLVPSTAKGDQSFQFDREPSLHRDPSLQREPFLQRDPSLQREPSLQSKQSLRSHKDPLVQRNTSIPRDPSFQSKQSLRSQRNQSHQGNNSLQGKKSLQKNQSLKLDTDEYLMPNGKSPNEIEISSLSGLNGNGHATTAV